MDLTYIVQQRSNSHALDWLPTKPDSSRDQLRVVRNPPRMAGSIWISRLDRLHHQLEQFLIDSLEFRIRLIELTNSNQWDAECNRAGGSGCGIDPGQKVDDREPKANRTGDSTSVFFRQIC